MRPIIEFCSSNLASGTDKVMHHLETNSHLDVVEYGCLGFCGECFQYPYALVDGKMVTAETAEALLEKIKQEIKASAGIDLE